MSPINFPRKLTMCPVICCELSTGKSDFGDFIKERTKFDLTASHLLMTIHSESKVNNDIATIWARVDQPHLAMLNPHELGKRRECMTSFDYSSSTT